MFTRIDHVEIVPSDFDRSYRFYTEVLGFHEWDRTEVDMPPLRKVVYVKLGDTMLELLDVETARATAYQPFQTGYHTMALEVVDMEKALAYLADKGYPCVWGPNPSNKDSIRAEIRDPDGLPVELRQWKATQ